MRLTSALAQVKSTPGRKSRNEVTEDEQPKNTRQARTLDQDKNPPLTGYKQGKNFVNSFF